MNDLALWNTLKAGDASALEKIYRAHAGILLGYGKKLCKDEQLVEDAIQDLFIELWKNRAGLGPTNAIRPYLITALRRKLVRMIKKNNQQQGELAIDQLPFTATLAIDETIIAQELSQEKSRLLKQATEKLSKRQKEVIYLKFYMEMSYKEIGEIMQLNYQSVRNLSFNALKSLKDKMLTGLLIFMTFFFELF